MLLRNPKNRNEDIFFIYGASFSFSFCCFFPGFLDNACYVFPYFVATTTQQFTLVTFTSAACLLHQQSGVHWNIFFYRYCDSKSILKINIAQISKISPIFIFILMYMLIHICYHQLITAHPGLKIEKVRKHIRKA